MLKSQAWRADRHSRPKPKPKRSPGPTISLFRQYPRPSSFRRGPPMRYRIVAVVVILGFYLLYLAIHSFHAGHKNQVENGKATIQLEGCCNYTTSDKAGEIRGAMILAFKTYKQNAWGSDDVLAISGEAQNGRNGWGAFIAESATTLAMLQLWEPFRQSVNHLLSIDFRDTKYGLIDPGESAEIYLGVYFSLADMVDEGIIPKNVVSSEKQAELVKKATDLAEILAKMYDTPSGLPAPKVDPKLGMPRWMPGGLTTSGRAASGVLEAMAMSVYSETKEFFEPVAKAWSLVTYQDSPRLIPGMTSESWSIDDGKPVMTSIRWDNHYETLLSAAILSPSDALMRPDPNSPLHANEWLKAARAVRSSLASRSQDTQAAPMQHLFLGSYQDIWYKNEMELSDCSVAGNLILGAAYTGQKTYKTLGLALLEGCEYVWATTPAGLPPKSIAWTPTLAYRYNTSFTPESDRQKAELATYGFWVTEAHFKVADAVGYVQSLFIAFRVTGDARYRESAWQVYQSVKRLWTRVGYAGVKDVMAPSSAESELIESDSRGVASLLMYLWLIFKEGSKGDLDRWVYTHGGHLLRSRE